MEHRRETVHLALGVLGNIATIVFFISSVPTVIKIIKEKSSGGLSGDLFVFKVFNCLLWTFYALPVVQPHNFWVLLTNSLGFIFALLYILPYLYYACRKERICMLWKLMILISSFIIVVVLLLSREHTRHTRVLVVGILCAIVSSCMHVALLSQMYVAVQTRELKYMHPKTSVAAFLKGAIWSAYGIVSLDPYIVVPNAVGIAIGCVELAVATAIWTRRRQEGLPTVHANSYTKRSVAPEPKGGKDEDDRIDTDNKKEKSKEGDQGTIAMVIVTSQMPEGVRIDVKLSSTT